MMTPKGTDPRMQDGPPARGLTGVRLLAAMAVAGLGLVFGSRAVASWADRLPEGWDQVRAAAVGWDQAMERAGLTVPYDRLHEWMRGAAGGG